jgi:hypothetical protein
MKTAITMLIAGGLSIAASPAPLPVVSGPVGIYGIVERVVFEPNERAPERVQLWGAFAYVDGGVAGNRAVSAAKRGFLYFKLPANVPATANQGGVDAVKKEWTDLKALAGTGQAIGFGSWFYIGGFSGLEPDRRSETPPYILENAPRGGSTTDMRVRSESETPRDPASYQTNAGIVKLSEQGIHATVVKQLRDALKR